MATRSTRHIGDRHSVLALVSGLVAIWALAGAAGLATGIVELGTAVEERIPLDSPVLAAVALAVVVGVPQALTAGLAVRADPRAPAVAMIAGGLLIGWIVLQAHTIEVFSWLQPVCVAAGLVVLSLGMALPPDPRRRLMPR
ncbi:hypothetical protein [Nocardia wallacei]|uniref:hypothetical protein n=1 Tax=Nocardia wallacei TaxID=480035 RepID=UPI002458687B|nr:hypothetical protein [Nocardia wallacei]